MEKEIVSKKTIIDLLMYLDSKELRKDIIPKITSFEDENGDDALQICLEKNKINNAYYLLLPMEDANENVVLYVNPFKKNNTGGSSLDKILLLSGAEKNALLNIVFKNYIIIEMIDSDSAYKLIEECIKNGNELKPSLNINRIDMLLNILIEKNELDHKNDIIEMIDNKIKTYNDPLLSKVKISYVTLKEKVNKL